MSTGAMPVGAMPVQAAPRKGDEYLYQFISADTVAGRRPNRMTGAARCPRTPIPLRHNDVVKADAGAATIGS